MPRSSVSEQWKNRIAVFQLEDFSLSEFTGICRYIPGRRWGTTYRPTEYTCDSLAS